MDSLSNRPIPSQHQFLPVGNANMSPELTNRYNAIKGFHEVLKSSVNIHELTSNKENKITSESFEHKLLTVATGLKKIHKEVDEFIALAKKEGFSNEQIEKEINIVELLVEFQTNIFSLENKLLSSKEDNAYLISIVKEDLLHDTVELALKLANLSKELVPNPEKSVQIQTSAETAQAQVRQVSLFGTIRSLFSSILPERPVFITPIDIPLPESKYLALGKFSELCTNDIKQFLNLGFEYERGIGDNTLKKVSVNSDTILLIPNQFAKDIERSPTCIDGKFLATEGVGERYLELKNALKVDDETMQRLCCFTHQGPTANLINAALEIIDLPGIFADFDPQANKFINDYSIISTPEGDALQWTNKKVFCFSGADISGDLEKINFSYVGTKLTVIVPLKDLKPNELNEGILGNSAQALVTVTRFANTLDEARDLVQWPK